MSKFEFTIIIEKDEKTGVYIGQLQEIPAVITEGNSLDELKENLKDALKLYLDVQKDMLKEENKKRKVFKRKLVFTL
jgi:predicted RNase H-like HicB family nuclease